jgi:deazaflavin-dependent oxidoreductase (nitroreductase family)
MLRDRIRVFNKYVTNRILRRFANLPFGPFAIIRHVGRRSGKPYETVIMVWPTGEGFVVALTYGPKVDWYRNMLAAGGGTVFWHRRVYVVGKPEPIDAKTALAVIPTPFRQILERIGLQDFVQVKIIEPSGALAERAEELPDVADKQIGDFHGGEVAAPAEL